jgi:sulfatase maturation enzyme AslB (radical SAM superfamily)
MMYDELLKKYICVTPFTYLELHKHGIFSCCPSWLPNKLGDLDDMENVWESQELKKIQESILDGSYKYCSKTECPYLSKLLNGNGLSFNFMLKESFNKESVKVGPTNVNFAFDRSCNLSCPTCRNVAIMANGEEIEFIDKTMSRVINEFGKSITMLYLSGSADPFASKSIRKLLLDFDLSKFPKLRQIHLHTNGLLLNEKMWNSLSHIHHLINTIEISIDASNKETYEIVRRGGNWETLITNLEFISKIKMGDKRVSFVVQDSNYMEMEDFYNLMMSIFNGDVNVYFNKITNWGTYNEDEFKLKQIWSESHSEFYIFLHQLTKINNKHKCIHNMYDIVETHLPKQTKSLI